MKRIRLFLLALAVVLLVCGCRKNDEEIWNTESDLEIKNETMAKEESVESGEIHQAESIIAGQETLSFEEFDLLEFHFASGAGAWCTIMTIDADGSFSGVYSDSDIGMNTVYYSEFNGQFSQPVKRNDYTYSMQILELNCTNEVDTEEIIDGILYKYTEPYGLEGTEEILIYMQGAPVAFLPDAYKSWVSYYIGENTFLPFYGLYNEAEENGFSSYHIIDKEKENIAFTEDWTTKIEADILNDASLTQTELNEKSQELYLWWDSALNRLWNVLKQVLDEETMRVLTEEELEWIDLKEAAVTDAGRKYEGGSVQPLVMNMKAAELTKERVYELLQLLD